MGRSGRSSDSVGSVIRLRVESVVTVRFGKHGKPITVGSVRVGIRVEMGALTSKQASWVRSEFRDEMRDGSGWYDEMGRTRTREDDDDELTRYETGRTVRYGTVRSRSTVQWDGEDESQG